MNPNYSQTITIYNCFRARDNPDSEKDIWQRTVLHDCFYKNIMGRSEHAVRDSKMDNAYTVRIPADARYVPYSEWCRLPEEKRRECFTCSLRDIVIKRECMDEISGISPYTAAEVLSRHKPESFAVTAFSDNTSHQRAKHYRLGG